MQVFAAAGDTVTGISRKGKTFFQFGTNLSDPVSSMWVGETDIHAVAGSSYTIFDNGQEAEFFLAPAPIGQMRMAQLTQPDKADAVLGCADRAVRVIAGSTPAFEVPVDQPVGALAVFPPGSTSTHMAVGGTSGQLSMLTGTGHTLRRGWAVENLGKHRGGGVTALAPWDGAGDGLPALVVGRDDGKVQVWRWEEGGVGSAPPSCQFTGQLGESVRCLETGCVTSSQAAQVVASTFGGRLVAFTSEALGDADADDAYGRSKATVQAEGHITALRAELKEMGAQLAQRRAKLVTSAAAGGAAPAAVLGTAAGPAGPAAEAPADEGLFAAMAASSAVGGIGDEEAVSVTAPAKAGAGGGSGHEEEAVAGVLAIAAPLTLEHACTLDTAEAAYVFSVEVSAPLDVIVLRSSLRLDVLDTGTLLCSACPSTPGTEDVYVATLRAQSAQERQARVKFRVVEGTAGYLHATVVVRTAPKAARTLQHSIAPLSLHHRLHTTPAAPLPPLHLLDITGTFTLKQAHDWMGACVPDMPGRPFLAPLASLPVTHAGAPEPPADDQGAQEGERLWFASAFLGTLLHFAAVEGRAVVQSDSASAIAIVKERFMAAATAGKQRIQPTFTLAPAATPHVLGLLHPKLEEALRLSRQADLAPALAELAAAEPSLPFLDPALASILKGGDRLAAAAAKAPDTLKVLRGMVSDLYVDTRRLQGQDGVGDMQRLQGLLTAYDQQALLRFFEGRA